MGINSYGVDRRGKQSSLGCLEGSVGTGRAPSRGPSGSLLPSIQSLNFLLQRAAMAIEFPKWRRVPVRPAMVQGPVDERL